MLRMRKTSDRVGGIKEYRPDLFHVMDKVTLAQYIGVSRAGLYPFHFSCSLINETFKRVFSKNNR